MPSRKAAKRKTVRSKQKRKRPGAGTKPVEVAANLVTEEAAAAGVVLPPLPKYLSDPSLHYLKAAHYAALDLNNPDMMTEEAKVFANKRMAVALEQRFFNQIQQGKRITPRQFVEVVRQYNASRGNAIRSAEMSLAARRSAMEAAVAWEMAQQQGGDETGGMDAEAIAATVAALVEQEFNMRLGKSPKDVSKTGGVSKEQVETSEPAIMSRGGAIG